MNMKTLLLSLTILLSVFYTCSNPTQPPIKPPPPVEPDSTTQNFTFETYEFGDGGSSSYLNDIWIFDENNIWAVGWISPDDPANNTYHVGNPNIVIWDGVKWNVPNFSGTSSGIYGLWAADSNNIYFATGGIVTYRNGTYTYVNTNLGLQSYQGIHKLWGSSQSNIWGVGPWGTIVHYDGNNWTKIDFDQQWYFYGITGNPETGIAYAYAQNNNDIRIIVQLSISSATVIHQSKQITAVKANAMNFIDSALYLAGSDFSSTLLWKFNPATKEIDSLYALAPTTAIDVISVEKKIDMFYWGEDYNAGKMVHYNGKRYKIFDLPKTNEIRGGAHTHNNISAVVGESNNKGYIIVVKRIKQ